MICHHSVRGYRQELFGDWGEGVMVRALSAMVAVLGGVLVVVPGGWLVLTIGSGERRAPRFRLGQAGARVDLL